MRRVRFAPDLLRPAQIQVIDNDLLNKKDKDIALIEPQIEEIHDNDIKGNFARYKDSYNTDIDKDNFDLLAAEKQCQEETSIKEKDLRNSDDYQLGPSSERVQKQS